MDLLKELAACNAVSVMFSVTTLDNRLAKVMEPRTSRPSLRLEAICTLAENDIPVGIIIGPVIPGLNDSEIPAIVAASVKAGAKAARYIMLRLPFGTKNLFENWLQQNFPERKEKVLNRLINMRDGKLYDPTFFKRDRGEGIFAEQIENLFNVSCHRNGIYQKRFELSTKHFIKQPSAQMELFS
jgi:DNA repair photolyase